MAGGCGPRSFTTSRSLVRLLPCLTAMQLRKTQAHGWSAVGTKCCAPQLSIRPHAFFFHRPATARPVPAKKLRLIHQGLLPAECNKVLLRFRVRRAAPLESPTPVEAVAAKLPIAL